MKLENLFKTEWTESVVEYSDSILEALLEMENANQIITSVEHGAIFKELLCELVTNESIESGEFELNQEHLNNLLKMASIFSSLITLQNNGIIAFTRDENGEEAFVVTPQGMEL